MSTWDELDDHLERHSRRDVPGCDYCREDVEEGAAMLEPSEGEVRGALLATIRERVQIAADALSLETPADVRNDLALTRVQLHRATGLTLEELRSLYATTAQLVERVAHCRGAA